MGIPRIHQLLDVARAGEELAHDVALRLVTRVADPADAAFLMRQAGQEHGHARVFAAAAAMLGRRPGREGDKLMRPFRRALESDLDSGRIDASVVGLHLVLEALGSEVVGRINLDLHGLGRAFAPVRRALLAQEDAHHRFGIRYVARTLLADPDRRPEIAAAATQYVALARELLDDCDALFTLSRATPSDYLALIRGRVADALVAA
jgi:hypothetical protein